MDKQEVINEIEKIDYQNLKYDSPERMLSAQKQLIIDTIKRLDKPQKVKVPAFVAEYIEAHRKWGPEIFIGDWLADNDAVYKWLYNNSEKENNRRFLIAVKAFVEGYEVEDEPQWVVMQGGSEVWYLQGFRNSLDGDIVKQWCSYEGCIKFTDLKKAEAVAKLVDGSVEEV